jgi:hypothetical protein
MPAGVQTKGPWRPQEFHSRLFRRAAALPVIAGVAASHQILPGGFPGTRTWNHMIEGHLARGQRPMAILARVAITHQDIFARKGARLMRDAPVFKQANHRGNIQAAACGVNLRGRNLFGRGDALQNQDQRPPSGADIDWLKTGIQNKDWPVKPIWTRHFTLPFAFFLLVF